MKTRSLDGFDFVDCYFREFSVHPLLSAITLKTEAYFPEYINPDERKLGVLTITLDGVTEVQAIIKPPFSHDLEGNEAYEVRLEGIDGGHHFFLSSDYLTLTVQCKQVLIEEAAN